MKGLKFKQRTDGFIDLITGDRPPMLGQKSIVVNSIWGLVKVEDRGSFKKTLWWMGGPSSFLQLL